MNRNLKALGLALVAVLAMSAMAASAASAASFTATSGATITAEDTGKIKFTVTGQEVWCEDATFTGTAPAASFTNITMRPVFSNCRTAITNPTPVTGFGVGECDFVLYANGTIDLVCAVGKDVTIDVGPCGVHIPAQKGLGTLTYTNNPSSGVVNIDINVIKITEFHTDGFLCPFGSTGHSVEGAFETPLNEPLTASASVGSLQWDA